MAQTFEEIQERHAEFIETFNATPHWAHKEREDGRRTPIKVLDWVRGRAVEPGTLHQLFQTIRFNRTVNRYGFVSIQRYYLYAEQGLSRKRVAICGPAQMTRYTFGKQKSGIAGHLS